MQHPIKFESKRGELPAVVMDETKAASSASSASFDGKEMPSPAPPSGSSGAAPISSKSAGSGSIVTSSMLNWDKDVREEQKKMSSNLGSKAGDGKIPADKFFIDDYEMCLAIEPGDGFYVVM